MGHYRLPRFEIGVISNRTINQITDTLELSLREKGINVSVEIEDFDNVVQDSHRSKDKKIVIVFWEVYNFLENFSTRIDSIEDTVFEDLVSRFEAEIAFFLQALEDIPIVFFNRFSLIVATKIDGNSQ